MSCLGAHLWLSETAASHRHKLRLDGLDLYVSIGSKKYVCSQGSDQQQKLKAKRMDQVDRYYTVQTFTTASCLDVCTAHHP